MIEKRDNLQLHTQCSRFLSHPAFLSSWVSVTLLPWGCPNSPAALMKPLGPAKDLQCKGGVLLALCYSCSCCWCHWCPSLWPLHTKSSSLPWEGSMILPNELIYLWRKGTEWQNLCQESLHFRTRNTVFPWVLWELPTGLWSQGDIYLLTSWKNSFHRRITQSGKQWLKSNSHAVFACQSIL